MDPQTPSPDVLRRMRELLVDCFAANEFRRFIADVDEAAERELPGEGSSQTALIADGVALLRRRGLIDARFFQKWADHRRARQREIFEVAVAMGFASLGTSTALVPGSACSESPSRSVPTGPTGPGCESWVLFAFLAILVATLIVFLSLHDSPFRVEYAVAFFLICSAILFAIMRQYLAAAAVMFVGLVILFWTGRRADRQRALPA